MQYPKVRYYLGTDTSSGGAARTCKLISEVDWDVSVGMSPRSHRCFAWDFTHANALYVILVFDHNEVGQYIICSVVLEELPRTLELLNKPINIVCIVDANQAGATQTGLIIHLNNATINWFSKNPLLLGQNSLPWG